MDGGTWLIEAFAQTQIGRLFGSAAALVAAWWWLVVPVFVIVFSAAWSFRYISRGAGQYGIIEGYVGTIGAGKTTLAVQHALGLALARDAVLLSNIPVICGPGCKADPPAHLIEHGTLPMNDDGLDLGDLMDRAFALRDQQRGLVLLMDEVGVVMPARLWKDFPVGLMWILQQSRKLACEWVWTAQDPSFVDHQLRSLTSVVHYVRSYPPPSVWRRVKGKRPWLLVASAFTPMQAPRANGDGMRDERRIGKRVVRYRRAWEASFDTDGVVLPSRTVKGAGLLISAAGRDRHAISTSLGVGMGGDLEPSESGG